jgi:hypothetical protein
MGIKPATCRLVSQYLKQLRYRVRPPFTVIDMKTENYRKWKDFKKKNKLFGETEGLNLLRALSLRVQNIKQGAFTRRK